MVYTVRVTLLLYFILQLKGSTIVGAEQVNSRIYIHRDLEQECSVNQTPPAGGAEVKPYRQYTLFRTVCEQLTSY